MTLTLERPPSAVAPPTQHRHKVRRLVLASVLVGLLGWAVVTALTLLRAAHALQSGVATIDDVRHQLGPEGISTDVPSGRLKLAEASFHRAHELLDRPYIAPFQVVPVLGRQLRSVTDLAGAASRVAHIGAGAVTDVHAALQTPRQTGADRLALLHRLASIAGDADKRLRAVGLGPSSALIKPLATKRAEFAGDLTKVEDALTQARAATAALTDFLGNSRSYLVLAANNAEMRSGSGMFLDAGVLSTTGDGHFSLGPVVSTTDLLLPPPGVPVSGDLAARWGFLGPNREWRNLGMSPQFGVNADLAARMWAAKTGQHVDGVLVVDVSALREVLQVTGPVRSGGVTVDASGVEQYLLHDQYLTAGADTSSVEAARHEQLGGLARAIFNTVDTADVSLVHLGPALARAADGRHLLAWSSNPSVEQDWATAGIAGDLGPDDLMLSVLNRGANKLDQYLSVRADLSVLASPSGDASDGTVTVSVRNDTPPGQPPYIAGHGAAANGSPGDYVGIISLDVPGRAGHLSLDGRLPLVAAGRDNSSHVLATQVTIKRGQAVSVTFRFRLSGPHGKLRVAPSARLPATAWQSEGSRFQDDTPHVVTW